MTSLGIRSVELILIVFVLTTKGKRTTRLLQPNRLRTRWFIGLVRRASTVVCFSLAGQVGAESNAPPPFQLLRYDENYRYLLSEPEPKSLWQELKAIPMGGSGADESYLSLGGEARYQYSYRTNEQWGRVPGNYGSVQQRYLLDADYWASSTLRIFGQLVSAEEHGRRPAPLPIDRDHLDAQQFFVELTEPFNAENARVRLRIGRQEIILGGHKILQAREGPNDQLSFDAVRLTVTAGPWQADVFASTMVAPQPGVFDDKWVQKNIEFWGANLARLRAFGPLRMDLFYLGYENRSIRYAQGSGHELRHTIGVRTDGQMGPWTFDNEVSGQFGTFAGAEIRAWGLASFTSYRFTDLPFAPKATFGLNYTSGDSNPSDRRLDTFNPLFARGDYYGDTTTLTGANVIDVTTSFEIRPTSKMRCLVQSDELWRSRTQDGLYGPPLIFFRSAGTDNNARYIGTQVTGLIGYAFNHFLDGQITLSHIFSGAFIRSASPSAEVNTVTTRLQLRF